MMKKCFLFSLIVLFTFLSFSMNNKTNDDHIFRKFNKFNMKYSRNYSSFTDMANKYHIFKANYLKMLNQRLSNRNSTIFGITQFMDIPFEQFNLQLSVTFKAAEDNQVDNSIRNTQQNLLNRSDVILSSIPESFDWRDKGIVSKVLNQNNCGACWAFSALVTVEGAYAIKYGRTYNISPQQIIDCNGSGFSCTFGQIMGAMTYLKSFRGIPIEQYPLQKQKNDCQYYRIQIEESFAKVEEYHRLFDVDENELMKMVYSMGPVAVNINAAYFQFYKGGIIDQDDCIPIVNHGVAIVGFGVENSIPYWIIKNSWGETWGEQGYLRLYRGKGLCGINSSVVIVIIK